MMAPLLRRDAGLVTVVVCVGLAAGSPAIAGSAAREDPFPAAQRAHWAFQDVVPQGLPRGNQESWARNAVDTFVLRELEGAGLRPAAEADRVTLLRRASLDLTGLPPTPGEAEAFLADRSPGAYERLVERLLASPHHGERWGRHWLDLARFAESSGFETDVTRPNAWRYRDYVVAAFNADKPYDRFVQEQIAGDELWPTSAEAIVATGFNRHYAEEGNQKDLLLARAETLNDITAVVGSTFLGLTIGCAQCHDHKFDPITQRDYYRLRAFFANASQDDRIPLAPLSERREHDRRLAIWEERTAPIWEEMSRLLMPLRNYTPAQLLARYPDYVIEAVSKPADQRSPIEAWMENLLAAKDCGTCALRPKPYLDPAFRGVARRLEGDDKARFEELDAQLAALAHLKPAEIPRASGMVDVGAVAPKTHVLGNGLHTSPLDEVLPGFPSIFDPGPATIVKPEGGRSTGRRAALAKWLSSPSNPLAARVMANRVWHYHFGRGIVDTPSDFGMMGGRPTHPELLDWLAGEFVRSGWSVKHMHRLIMLSSTYRQASVPASTERADLDPATADPFNKLLWKYPRRRLEGESLRDSALAVAGALNARVGGPGVFPPLPEGTPAPRGGWTAGQVGSDHRRRSLYIFVRRNSPYPMLDALDFPDTHEPCPARDQTTTAPQALALLNGREPAAWARAFAGRVLAVAGSGRSAQVDVAYRLAYSRYPTPAEKDTAATFLDRQAGIIDRSGLATEPSVPGAALAGIDDAEVAALSDLCLMLLNSNEFAYRF